MKRVESIANDIIKFNVNKTSLDKFNLYLIAFMLVIILIPRLLYNFTTIKFEYIYNYYLILLLPMIYIFIYNIKNKYHKNSLDFILITIFMVIAFISSMHAFNPWKAFFGDVGRKTGYITYIMYYFTYFNSKNINNKDDLFKVLNVMFIIGIINAVFALLQTYLPYNSVINKMYINMGYGLIGNPNFMATFALLLLSLSLYISLFIKQSKFYIFVTIIMYACLVSASSTGPFITFILLLFVLLIYTIIKRKSVIKKLLIYILLFVIMFIGIEGSSIYINRNVYKYKIKKTSLISNDIVNIFNIVRNKYSYKDLIDEDIEIDYDYNKMDQLDAISSGRLYVYKAVTKYIVSNNYIWLGTGPDNMNIYHIDWVDEDNRAVMTNYDKAHNIYLNVIAETGIFSFICYIAWIICYHVKTKKCKNELMYLLLFGLISYNIQGLFNIDVLVVMPYYLIVAGMLMGIGDKLETRKH